MLAGGQFVLIDGVSKVRQDLALALQEPFGVDRFHPRWGSLLLNYLGQPVNESTSLLIRTEVNRIIQNYIASQAAQFNQDQMDGTKPSFSMEEIVQGVKEINIRQEFDAFHIQVRLTTAAQEPLTLTSSITG